MKLDVEPTVVLLSTRADQGPAEQNEHGELNPTDSGKKGPMLYIEILKQLMLTWDFGRHAIPITVPRRRTSVSRIRFRGREDEAC